MIIPDWNLLPPDLQLPQVRPYYDFLKTKQVQLVIKRCFDVVLSLILIILLLPVFVFVAWKIHKEDGGEVFFRQHRVTALCKQFEILKFRTMTQDAQQKGPQLTLQNDQRITTVGKRIRRLRLDEIPQLFNVLRGDMSFVGPRPEVPRFVEHYTPEMMATLLMPAGITSEASIAFKDEDVLLSKTSDPDEAYIRVILPEKMKHNLQALYHINLYNDLKTMIKTVFAVQS